MLRELSHRHGHAVAPCPVQITVESVALPHFVGCLPDSKTPESVASHLLVLNKEAVLATAPASTGGTLSVYDSRAAPRRPVSPHPCECNSLAASAPTRLARLRFVELSSSRQAVAAVSAVIGALSGRRKAAHVPYRDSKLTRLLAPALGTALQRVAALVYDVCQH